MSNVDILVLTKDGTISSCRYVKAISGEEISNGLPASMRFITMNDEKLDGLNKAIEDVTHWKPQDR